MGAIFQRGEEARGRAGADQGSAQAVADEVVDAVLLAEADFGFGRMNIDIHLFRRHLQEEQDDGEGGWRNDVAVGLADRVQQQPVADKPLVDKDIDGVAVELLQLRLGVEAAQPQVSRARVAGSSGSRFQGGGSGRPEWSSGASAATGRSWPRVSAPKI